jgi:hypothetical protein
MKEAVFPIPTSSVAPNQLSASLIPTSNMFRHPSFPASAVDSEDSIVDISTAPTTPDGSLSFSPVLQALKLQDALEDAASGRGKQRTSSTSLNAAMHSNNGGVKNICCIGAGYVGMNLTDLRNLPADIMQVVPQQL